MTATENPVTATELTMFQGVVDPVAATISTATADELGAPSPCSGWSARDVLNHMIGAADMFAACARGQQQPFPDWSAMPDWVGADPVASYRRSGVALTAAFGAPGVLDGAVSMPWGDMPARFALNLIMADHVAHAWDLARATGLEIEIRDDAAETALATMRVAVSPELRSAGFYGPEQAAPEDASTLDRLAAFTGRPLSISR